MQSEGGQSKTKTLAYIAALLAAVTAVTFLFKAADKIASIPLKIAALYGIYLLLIALVVLVCRLEKRSVFDLGFSRVNLSAQILTGAAIALALSFLIGALPILIGGSGASLIGGKPSGTFSIIYSIVTNLLFIGTCEELIFRGYVQTRLGELTGHKYAGVIVAAALFGLWHIITGFWMQVIFTAFIGAAFGFCRAYLKNCSLLSVIIAHGLYNALLVVIRLILL